MRKPCLRERQPHREGRRAAPNHPDHRRAPGRPEVIAADEVAAEGLAHARTLKMTSVDVTDARWPDLVRMQFVGATRRVLNLLWPDCMAGKPRCEGD